MAAAGCCWLLAAAANCYENREEVCMCLLKCMDLTQQK
jgi:hypothetical protein